MTALEMALEKKLPEYVDRAYWLERIRQHDQHDWIAPNNTLEHSDYSIFFEMAELGLVGLRRMPIWENGCYRGVKVYFMYSETLDFKNA